MLKRIFLLCITILFFCCKENQQQDFSLENMMQNKREIEKEFGENALYKSIKWQKNSVTVIVIEPQKKYLIEKKYEQQKWTILSNVEMHIEGDAQIQDFLFRLNTIDFQVITKLLQEFKTQSTDNENISCEITVPDFVVEKSEPFILIKSYKNQKKYSLKGVPMS